MKLNFKTTLVLFFLLTVAAFAQEKDKTVTLTVSGSGKTQDEAKQSALRSAIEQAFGAFISSKTEILNDKVIADQISSVASGNIQSFDILNAAQLPDGSWGVTLKALVSVSKLASFVEAKGFSVEIKGGLFAMNIKQQILNEEGEVKAIAEMVGLLHEPMQTAFDYEIKSSEPKAAGLLGMGNDNWTIDIEVKAIANKNMNFCAEYFIKTLENLSMTKEETANYSTLKKYYCEIIATYKGIVSHLFLRNPYSFSLINEFRSNYNFYTRSFIVHSDGEDTTGYGAGTIFNIGDVGFKELNFLAAGQLAGTFKWEEKRTLKQIEKMNGFSVKPSGVRSQFKHGGYVMSEKNGHGIAVALMDKGSSTSLGNWLEAKTACDELDINGYNDWRLPSRDELDLIRVELHGKQIGMFLTATKLNGVAKKLGKPETNFGSRGVPYWSLDLRSKDNQWTQNFETGVQFYDPIIMISNVRAVRSF
jgi:hypothetical protein